MANAVITLEVYNSGIHFMCDDIDEDDFIPIGDGNKLIELINKVQYETDPNATFALTEKGKELLNKLENEDMV